MPRWSKFKGAKIAKELSAFDERLSKAVHSDPHLYLNPSHCDYSDFWKV